MTVVRRCRFNRRIAPRLCVRFGLPGLMVLLGLLTGCFGRAAARPADRLPYGVFIGLEPERRSQLLAYQTVVIDATDYTRDDIATLRQAGVCVYTYLNIGSVETFRTFYPKHRAHVLRPYRNWPDEYWVDVTRAAWQDQVQTAAAGFSDKGVDGFFLDNADVYDEYRTPAVFDGLTAMVRRVGAFGKPILINGGSRFVTEAVLDASEPLNEITSVNQECVWTAIDFENGRTVRQTPEGTAYFQAYLERCTAAGLSVYLTEYDSSGDAALRAAVDDYCAPRRMVWYVASDPALDGR